MSAGPVLNRIAIVEGDITKQRVDAIVNAANNTLLVCFGANALEVHRNALREICL